jgi:hypothetical protein
MEKKEKKELEACSLIAHTREKKEVFASFEIGLG